MDTNRYAVPRDDRQEAARAALKTLEVWDLYRGMANTARLFDGTMGHTPGGVGTHYRFVTAIDGDRRVILLEREDGVFIPWSY